jgi:two-component sensor histidine kinase
VTDTKKYLESENARLRALLKQAGLDAEASEVARKLQQALLSELHHRIKNLLAMVQSIVMQTLRSARSPGEASEAITNRIAALAKTHDIILSTAGEGSPLFLLLETITAPFGERRFQIKVPAAHVSSRVAVPLALVVNELATNAVKHGALSVSEGSVDITGRIDDATSEVVLTWVEAGGPAVQEPSRRGFGTQLIQVVLPIAPQLEFRPRGSGVRTSCATPRGQLKVGYLLLVATTFSNSPKS